MGIELRHIIGIEKEKTQNQVIFELTNGDGLNTIFGEEHFTSRKNTSNKIWNSTQLGYMALQNNLSLQS